MKRINFNFFRRVIWIILEITDWDPKGVDNIFSSLKLFSSLHITPLFPKTFSKVIERNINKITGWNTTNGARELNKKNFKLWKTTAEISKIEQNISIVAVWQKNGIPEKRPKTQMKQRLKTNNGASQFDKETKNGIGVPVNTLQTRIRLTSWWWEFFYSGLLPIPRQNK